MRIFAPIFFVLFSFLSTTANATVITYHDGEAHPFDIADQIVFADSLTTADPQVTYGFILGTEDHASLRVTAPVGIDLVARITSRPDFDGQAIVLPNSESRVYSGEYFDFPLWGDWTGIGQGEVWWLTIAVLDEDSLAALADDYGDSLPITSTTADNDYVWLPGGSGTGGGGNVSPIPEPSSVLLMTSGLLALGFTVRQKKRVI